MIELTLRPNQKHIFGVYRRIGEHQTEDLFCDAHIGMKIEPDRIEVGPDAVGSYLTADELIELGQAIKREAAYFRQPKAFKVASVSENSNSFGLHGHVLVAQDGEAWQCGRSQGAWNEPIWRRGMVVTLRPSGLADWDFAGHSCEIPNKLSPPPPPVINEIWSIPDPSKPSNENKT